MAAGATIPPECGHDWQRSTSRVAQLAEDELTLHLEPHDEEENDHQTVVDPMLERMEHPKTAQLDAQFGGPQAIIGIAE
jgi:hypothetical protein